MSLDSTLLAGYPEPGLIVPVAWAIEERVTDEAGFTWRRRETTPIFDDVSMALAHKWRLENQWPEHAFRVAPVR